MKLYKIKTSLPMTSIANKETIFSSYKTIAEDFDSVLVIARKKLNKNIQEKVHSIIYLDEVEFDLIEVEKRI